MATRPQVLPIELVTTLTNPGLVSEEANDGQISRKLYVTILLQLPGAVGQPVCPTPQILAHSLPVGDSKQGDNGRHPIVDTPGLHEKLNSRKRDERRLSSLRKIFVSAGLLIIIPAFAVLFGVSIMRCTLAWTWLCISFMLVVTALLFLNGSLSRSDFAKLWKSFLNILTKIVGSASDSQ